MLPRDISGDELIRLLRRGTSVGQSDNVPAISGWFTNIRGVEHHVSLPRHN